MPAPLPSAVGLTLAEAFHLMSRALGELPVPVSGDTLRARMAALHGKEDLLLDTSRFNMLLRQANDAEVADVRALGPDQYEVSPHKSDLAMHRRPAVETKPSAEGVESTPAPAPERRFRGGARAAARPGALQMVGVIDLNGGTPIVTTPVVVTPVGAVTLPATPKPTESTRPARGAKPAKPAATPKPKVAAKPAPKAKVAAKPAKSAAPKAEKKAAAPRTPKVRAG